MGNPALVRIRRRHRPALRWMLQTSPHGDGYLFPTRARARAHRRFLRDAIKRDCRVIRLREEPASA